MTISIISLYRGGLATSPRPSHMVEVYQEDGSFLEGHVSGYGWFADEFPHRGDTMRYPHDKSWGSMSRCINVSEMLFGVSSLIRLSYRRVGGR